MALGAVVYVGTWAAREPRDLLPATAAIVWLYVADSEAALDRSGALRDELWSWQTRLLTRALDRRIDRAASDDRVEEFAMSLAWLLDGGADESTKRSIRDAFRRFFRHPNPKFRGLFAPMAYDYLDPEGALELLAAMQSEPDPRAREIGFSLVGLGLRESPEHERLREALLDAATTSIDPYERRQMLWAFSIAGFDDRTAAGIRMRIAPRRDDSDPGVRAQWTGTMARLLPENERVGFLETQAATEDRPRAIAALSRARDLNVVSDALITRAVDALRATADGEWDSGGPDGPDGEEPWYESADGVRFVAIDYLEMVAQHSPARLVPHREAIQAASPPSPWARESAKAWRLIQEAIDVDPAKTKPAPEAEADE